MTTGGAALVEKIDPPFTTAELRACRISPAKYLLLATSMSEFMLLIVTVSPLAKIGPTTLGVSVETTPPLNTPLHPPQKNGNAAAAPNCKLLVVRLLFWELARKLHVRPVGTQL